MMQNESNAEGHSVALHEHISASTSIKLRNYDSTILPELMHAKSYREHNHVAIKLAREKDKQQSPNVAERIIRSQQMYSKFRSEQRQERNHQVAEDNDEHHLFQLLEDPHDHDPHMEGGEHKAVSDHHMYFHLPPLNPDDHLYNSMSYMHTNHGMPHKKHLPYPYITKIYNHRKKNDYVRLHPVYTNSAYANNILWSKKSIELEYMLRQFIHYDEDIRIGTAAAANMSSASQPEPKPPSGGGVVRSRATSIIGSMDLLSQPAMRRLSMVSNSTYGTDVFSNGGNNHNNDEISSNAEDELNPLVALIQENLFLYNILPSGYDVCTVDLIWTNDNTNQDQEAVHRLTSEGTAQTQSRSIRKESYRRLELDAFLLNAINDYASLFKQIHSERGLSHFIAEHNILHDNTHLKMNLKQKDEVADQFDAILQQHIQQLFDAEERKAARGIALESQIREVELKYEARKGGYYPGGDFGEDSEDGNNADVNISEESKAAIHKKHIPNLDGNFKTEAVLIAISADLLNIDRKNATNRDDIHIRPLCTSGDISLAMQELLDPRVFSSGYIAVPHILQMNLFRQSEGFYRVEYHAKEGIVIKFMKNALPSACRELAPFMPFIPFLKTDECYAEEIIYSSDEHLAFNQKARRNNQGSGSDSPRSKSPRVQSSPRNTSGKTPFWSNNASSTRGGGSPRSKKRHFNNFQHIPEPLYQYIYHLIRKLNDIYRVCTKVILSVVFDFESLVMLEHYTADASKRPMPHIATRQGLTDTSYQYRLVNLHHIQVKQCLTHFRRKAIGELDGIERNFLRDYYRTFRTEWKTIIRKEHNLSNKCDFYAITPAQRSAIRHAHKIYQQYEEDLDFSSDDESSDDDDDFNLLDADSPEPPPLPESPREKQHLASIDLLSNYHISLQQAEEARKKRREEKERLAGIKADDIKRKGPVRRLKKAKGMRWSSFDVGDDDSNLNSKQDLQVAGEQDLFQEEMQQARDSFDQQRIEQIESKLQSHYESYQVQSVHNANSFASDRIDTPKTPNRFFNPYQSKMIKLDDDNAARDYQRHLPAAKELLDMNTTSRDPRKHPVFSKLHPPKVAIAEEDKQPEKKKKKFDPFPYLEKLNQEAYRLAEKLDVLELLSTEPAKPLKRPPSTGPPRLTTISIDTAHSVMSRKSSASAMSPQAFKAAIVSPTEEIHSPYSFEDDYNMHKPRTITPSALVQKLQLAIDEVHYSDTDSSGDDKEEKEGGDESARKSGRFLPNRSSHVSAKVTGSDLTTTEEEKRILEFILQAIDPHLSRRLRKGIALQDERDKIKRMQRFTQRRRQQEALTEGQVDNLINFHSTLSFEEFSDSSSDGEKDQIPEEYSVADNAQINTLLGEYNDINIIQQILNRPQANVVKRKRIKSINPTGYFRRSTDASIDPEFYRRLTAPPTPSSRRGSDANRRISSRYLTMRLSMNNILLDGKELPSREDGDDDYDDDSDDDEESMWERMTDTLTSINDQLESRSRLLSAGSSSPHHQIGGKLWGDNVTLQDHLQRMNIRRASRASFRNSPGEKSLESDLYPATDRIEEEHDEEEENMHSDLHYNLEQRNAFYRMAIAQDFVEEVMLAGIQRVLKSNNEPVDDTVIAKRASLILSDITAVQSRDELVFRRQLLSRDDVLRPQDTVVTESLSAAVENEHDAVVESILSAKPSLAEGVDDLESLLRSVQMHKTDAHEDPFLHNAAAPPHQFPLGSKHQPLVLRPLTSSAAHLDAQFQRISALISDKPKTSTQLTSPRKLAATPRTAKHTQELGPSRPTTSKPSTSHTKCHPSQSPKVNLGLKGHTMLKRELSNFSNSTISTQVTVEDKPDEHAVNQLEELQVNELASSGMFYGSAGMDASYDLWTRIGTSGMSAEASIDPYISILSVHGRDPASKSDSLQQLLPHAASIFSAESSRPELNTQDNSYITDGSGPDAAQESKHMSMEGTISRGSQGQDSDMPESKEVDDGTSIFSGNPESVHSLLSLENFRLPPETLSQRNTSRGTQGSHLDFPVPGMRSMTPPVPVLGRNKQGNVTEYEIIATRPNQPPSKHIVSSLLQSIENNKVHHDQRSNSPSKLTTDDRIQEDPGKSHNKVFSPNQRKRILKPSSGGQDKKESILIPQVIPIAPRSPAPFSPTSTAAKSFFSGIGQQRWEQQR